MTRKKRGYKPSNPCGLYATKAMLIHPVMTDNGVIDEGDIILVTPVKNQRVYRGKFWAVEPESSDRYENVFKMAMIDRESFVLLENLKSAQYLKSWQEHE